MSKAIEAFIRLDHNTKRYKGRKEDLDIVFAALKDYEMEHTLRIRLENINYELVREKQENEKKLKALEIIKKERVNVEYITACENYEQYRTICSYWNEITIDEFYLLREVLLCLKD